MSPTCKISPELESRDATWAPAERLSGMSDYEKGTQAQTIPTPLAARLHPSPLKDCLRGQLHRYRRLFTPQASIPTICLRPSRSARRSLRVALRPCFRPRPWCPLRMLSSPRDQTLSSSRNRMTSAILDGYQARAGRRYHVTLVRYLHMHLPRWDKTKPVSRTNVLREQRGICLLYIRS
jgi:hypothetical protein